MKLVFALLLACLIFAGLILTALWMRIQDLKNSRARAEALTLGRMQLFRDLAARWPGKDWPLLDTSDPLRLDHGLTAAFRALAAELEASPALLQDPEVAAAWVRVAQLEEQMPKARLALALAVKSHNRALDLLPTSLVAKPLNLKKAPRPSGFAE